MPSGTPNNLFSLFLYEFVHYKTYETYRFQCFPRCGSSDKCLCFPHVQQFHPFGLEFSMTHQAWEGLTVVSYFRARHKSRLSWWPRKKLQPATRWPAAALRKVSGYLSTKFKLHLAGRIATSKFLANQNLRKISKTWLSPKVLWTRTRHATSKFHTNPPATKYNTRIINSTHE